ncbi:MAG: DUF3794 domain-containing protein [Lachnospiraceae bacterium]|nr:DUF3794 domain-containing protein [bacterium]MDY5518657.1 DUF3794 domain-containing protein [Lachnospiraceae bacterium]
MEAAEYLECERRQIHVICEKGKAITQITLDDDYNLAEYKPDILKIIEDKGQVRMEEIKVETDLVRLRGVLHFEVLYRSNGEDSYFGNLQGEIPFQENVRMEGAGEYDLVYVDPQIEDLSIGLINSRKLEIRSLITMQLQLRQPCAHALATDLSGSPGEHVQVLREEIEALELLGQKKDTSRFRTEVSLPSNKPGIREILWYSIQPRGVESRLSDGKIELGGELFVHMVYLGTEESGQLQCLELAVPLQTQVDAEEADPQLLSWVRVRLLSGELEAAEDFDGEERMLQLSAMLEVDYTLWQEQTLTLLQDAYATDRDLNCVREDVTLQHLLVKNDSRFRINERMKLDTAAQVLQICSCAGNVQVEEVTPAEGRLEVSGILKMKLLYIAANDEMPLMTVDETLPFSEVIEVPGLLPEMSDISYELEAGIDQLTTALIDQSQVECKAQIRLCVIIFENLHVKNVEKIDVSEMDEKQLRMQPGMIGYIVKNGEKLWDIAKAHRVTMRQLMEQNGLADETVHPKDKLMIVKTIG